MRRIIAAARETLTLAHLRAGDISALYVTVGSTGFGALADAIATVVPNAQRVALERFASVVSGLGLSAARTSHLSIILETAVDRLRCLKVRV